MLIATYTCTFGANFICEYFHTGFVLGIDDLEGQGFGEDSWLMVDRSLNIELLNQEKLVSCLDLNPSYYMLLTRLRVKV